MCSIPGSQCERAAPRPPRRSPAIPAWALVLLIAFALPAPCRAEIYRWTDESGNVHFSDSLHSVPERYRRQVQGRSTALPPAPAPAPREKSAPAPPSDEVPLEKKEGGYLVKAVFNDRDTASLIVDTGASSTVISPSFAARLGLTVRWDPPVTLKTAGGDARAGWAEVDSVDVGGHRVSPLRVIVHEFTDTADGLLGMNFLHSFRVEIRAQRPSLVLSPP